jgi:hypothetical protein
MADENEYKKYPYLLEQKAQNKPNFSSHHFKKWGSNKPHKKKKPPQVFSRAEDKYEN